MIYVYLNIFLVLIVFLLLLLYFDYSKFETYSNAMQPQDAKFLKRKVKSGSIDVHPTEKALVLSYELEYQVLSESGEEIFRDKRDLEKIIALPSLNTKTDCSALGKAVIEKCELLHPSKLAEVEQLIFYLKTRKISPKSGISRSNSASVETKPESASIARIEAYMEMLYEDIPSKIKGSALILQLARESDNLDFLSKNESVLSVLSRVLREDWRRSIVLSTNLIYIFFCFSTYVDFHPLILHYKIGSLCMDIIQHELASYEAWKLELSAVEKSSEEASTETTRSKIPEPVRPRSGNWAMSTSSTSDDLTNSIDNSEDRNKSQLTDAERAKRYRTLIKKQEQLLRVAFYLLLNISVEEYVEEKMVKKNIVKYLVQTLERENEDLLLLVMTFLKKLSIFDINKDLMVEMNIVDMLPPLLHSDNADLVHLTLKLLFNLSFDEKLRNKMVERGFLPTFVNLLSDDRHQNVIIKLLYHLSMDDKVKAMFTYTDCISLIIDMILLCKDDTCSNDMIGLGINLAVNENNALQMVENKRLKNLMARAFKFQNFYLMKMVRNISEHKLIQPQFVDYVGDLSHALRKSKSEEFIQECLGVLGNITASDLDYIKLFEHFNLMPWFYNELKSKHEDDFILDLVIFLGNAATDKECAELFCKQNILRDLIEFMKIHQEDDEIVYQILYLFLQVLQHKETRNHVIMDTEAPAYFIDLFQDQNKIVSNICGTCLEIISDCNPDWARRIQIEKFRNHNAQWLQMVESQAADEADKDDEVTELPPYMNAEFLATHSVPTLEEKKDADKEECNYSEDVALDSLEDLTNRFDKDLDLE